MAQRADGFPPRSTPSAPSSNTRRSRFAPRAYWPDQQRFQFPREVRAPSGKAELVGIGEINLDTKTIASFGDEWSRFDQAAMSHEEAEAVFRDYFAVFPWEQLPPEAEGFDMGCGSGRWSRFVALNALDTNSRLVPGQKVKLVVY